MRNLARSTVSALFLVIALVNSGCLSERVARTAFPDTVQASISLRVDHCYTNPAGQLVVAGEGGPYQDNLAETPRAPIWFMADLPALAKAAKGGAAVLPQTVLRPGSPGPAWLAQEQFTELPFAEYNYNSPVPRGAGPASPPVEPSVKIIYWDMFITKNFPERLGHRPEFVVQNDPEIPPVSVLVMDTENKTNYGLLPLLPVAAAGDTLAAGGYVAGIDPCLTLFFLSAARVDHNLKNGNHWP